jgi:hypothetical protein
MLNAKAVQFWHVQGTRSCRVKPNTTLPDWAGKSTLPKRLATPNNNSKQAIQTYDMQRREAHH